LYRFGNTRLLRIKKDIVDIYDKITDDPMHYSLLKKDNNQVLNKFNFEIPPDQNNDNTNIRTLCCHTHLNYNFRKFTKSKLAQKNELVNYFDTNESIFYNESDEHVVELFTLLDNQKYLYKLVNSK
jgi:hypothetical protein